MLVSWAGRCGCIKHELPMTAPYAKSLAYVVIHNTSDDALAVGKEDNGSWKVCRNSSHAEMSLQASTVKRIVGSPRAKPHVRSMRRLRKVRPWVIEGANQGLHFFGAIFFLLTRLQSFYWKYVTLSRGNPSACSRYQLRYHDVWPLGKWALF